MNDRGRNSKVRKKAESLKFRFGSIFFIIENDLENRKEYRNDYKKHPRIDRDPVK